MNSMIAVKKADVPEVWPEVKHLFKKITDRQKDYSSLDGMKQRFIDGSYIMLLVVDGAVPKMALAAEVVTCDSGNKILMIPHLAGDDMASWLDLIVDEIYALAGRLGCFRAMICGGRPGWIKTMKKHGGELSHVVIEFDTEKYINRGADNGR